MGIKGYKVFDSDWACRPFRGFKQYSCPGRFQQKGDLKICENGMHFCRNLVDCFDYYAFDPDNKVAEIIAHGVVLQDGETCCTDDLEVVREIPWEEVLILTNTGRNCAGISNTGYYNIGSYNSGNHNSGNRNSGHWNIGHWNTGNDNFGNHNSGSHNSGLWNTGDGNSGNRNTGNCNIGDHNTGDWNVSSFNTGCFMTKEQPLMMFNKPSSWTFKMWHESDARWLLDKIPKEVTKWVSIYDMTDQEKEEHPEYQTTGGYLKTLDESDAAQLWWDKLSQKKRDIILDLPNFDADIFKQCTGIDVRKGKEE